jgi:hypothetical protein
VTVYRRRANTLSALSQTLGAPLEDIERAVSRLVDDGRVKWDRDRHDNASELTATALLVPVGAKQGWEAAVFDHYSTVAAAIAAKVTRGPSSRADDVVGGATLSFEIHANHPHREKVLGLLAHIRDEVNALWNQVENYNRDNPVPEDAIEKVHFYFGQNAELHGERSSW